MAETQPMNLDALCYEPEEDRQFLASMVCGQGVADVSGGDLLVSTTASGNNSVSVAAGSGFIQNDESVGEPQMYWVLNDAPVVLQHTANPAGDPRIDMIVATVHDNQYGGGLDDWELSVVAGTATAGAQVTAPLSAGYHAGVGVIPDNSIVLSYVRILAGSTLVSTILAADVEDARSPFVQCGEEKVLSTEWTKTVDQSVPHNTDTLVTLTAGPSGSAVPNPFYSESGGIITFHEPGVYDVLASVVWEPTATVVWQRAMIYRNSSVLEQVQALVQTSPSVPAMQLVTATARVVAGDTISLRVSQGQNPNAALLVGAASVTVTRLGVLAA